MPIAERGLLPITPATTDTGQRALTRLAELAGDAFFLDIAQLCLFLGISVRTYYRMRRAGTWPIPEMWPRFTTPRYHVDDIAQYLCTAAACKAGDRLALLKRR